MTELGAAVTRSEVVAAGGSDTIGGLETAGAELSSAGDISAIEDVGATLAT